MRKSHSSNVRLMIIVCCVGLFSLLLPTQAEAKLYCWAKVKEVKVWSHQGYVGAQLKLGGGEIRTWLLCDVDTPVIPERQCYVFLNQLNIAKVTGSPVRLEFSDDVPDESGKPALACNQIKEWVSLEADFNIMTLLDTP